MVTENVLDPEQERQRQIQAIEAPQIPRVSESADISPEVVSKDNMWAAAGETRGHSSATFDLADSLQDASHTNNAKRLEMVGDIYTPSVQC